VINLSVLGNNGETILSNDNVVFSDLLYFDEDPDDRCYQRHIFISSSYSSYGIKNDILNTLQEHVNNNWPINIKINNNSVLSGVPFLFVLKKMPTDRTIFKMII